MSTENDDVPLGDEARRYYERRFGDRIRKVRKGGGAAKASDGGSFWNGGRAGCGGLVITFFIFRLIVALFRTQSHTSYDYSQPPAFNPPQRFRELFDKEEQQKRFLPPGLPVQKEDEEAAALLDVSEVPLLEGLCYRIYQESRQRQPTPGGRIGTLLDDAAKNLLRKAARGQKLDAEQIDALVDALNELLRRPDFFDEPSFRNVPGVADLLAGRRLRARDFMRGSLAFNRTLLEMCYPRQIVPFTQPELLGGPALDAFRRSAQADLAQARQQYEPAKR